ncbi:von Willebrand factor type A domain protein [Micromonospora sp. MW-13]|uniref:vWA domain-containing protein n=1 Tax=unclassified Micromonospora TaxID=2617518 RepID=UPI000E444645|nr:MULTISPECIES: vWA domain-containing protein [unclassified Micromonospora]MCX4473563.1 VWA domain-containing protein [Micromonospora sp. NBC_01655]RGC65773.1 von Willebrand factor type A domain protein [Micromonospora sp. MW-13]
MGSVRRTAAGFLATLAALAAVGLPGGPVTAAPATGDEVYAALGVNRVAGDYVVLVDVSRSMREGRRYERVKASLRSFLAALAPDDRIALVTFADSARVVHDGPAGRSPDQVVGKLPRTADGRHTDIGAAIETSLRLLNRQGTPQIATVVLLTDGRHDPPAGSAYPFEQGYAWNQLAGAGRSLRKTSLNAYAVPLAGSTGAPLLARVYPGARILAPASIDRLGAQLEQPKSAARAAKARSVLGDDAAHGIQVTWPAATGRLDGGRTRLEVRLRSTATRIPLVVDHLAVRSDRPDLRVTVPAGPVELPPGGTATVPVTVEWDPGPRRVAPLSEVTASTTLSLSGDVGSPWADVLTGDLGLAFPPRLDGGVTSVSLSAQRGSLGWWVAGGVLLLALAGVGWWGRRRRLSPPLAGTLRVRAPGGEERELPLAGRRAALTAGSAGLPGYGEVTASRSSAASAEIRLVIRYSPDGSAAGRQAGTCGPGETVELGGAAFTWRPAAPGRRGGVASVSGTAR